MQDQLKALFANHGLWGFIGLWALRETAPKAWAYLSTTGTDSAVRSLMSDLVYALKNHGATDPEINTVVSGIYSVLNRVATDVQASQASLK
jgi:hypothetical protein